MPDELAAQIPLVHRACEALGVPILTAERYEADDVIGTMTDEGASAEGYDVAIVTGDKDFFQLVRDGIRVFNPRDDGTWYDAAGVKEKFGVAPGAGGRRARADGRHHRQRQGRARHRRERRARSDLHVRHRSTRCSSTPPRCRRRSIAKRCSRTCRGGAQQPRAAADPHRRAGRVRHRGASATAGRRARRASSSSPSSASARSSTEYAPTADTIAKDYRIVTTADGARGAGRASCARAGRFALRVLPDAPGRDARRRSSASRSRRRRGTAGYVPVAATRARHARAARLPAELDAPSRSPLSRRRSAALQAGARGSRRSRRSATT